MGSLRKASLCDTFPLFDGVVLFMAGEGNEQLAGPAKANTAAAARLPGLAGALLGGGCCLRVPGCSRRAEHPSRSPQRGNLSAMETGHTRANGPCPGRFDPP